MLGAAATLERNPVWAALLANARERGCVVSEASARCDNVGVVLFGSDTAIQESDIVKHAIVDRHSPQTCAL